MLLVFVVLCRFIIYTTQQLCEKIYNDYESIFPPVNRELSDSEINDIIKGPVS